MLQCGILIPVLPLNFLIQLVVVVLFLVAGLPDVLTGVGAAGSRTTWRLSGALQGEVPGGKCSSGLFLLGTGVPRNEHGVNVTSAKTPTVLSGGLAAGKIPHHSSQKWLRRDASVGGPFLGWASAKHTA